MNGGIGGPRPGGGRVLIVALVVMGLVGALLLFLASGWGDGVVTDDVVTATPPQGRGADWLSAAPPQVTRAYPATYSGTPTPDTTPADRLDPTTSQTYTVQQGDTLGGIAYAFGCTVEEMSAANGLDSDAIWPGQVLVVPVGASEFGPAVKLVPDSELVYGPAYIHFDLDEFVAAQDGYLAAYSEEVEGRERSGAEIVQLVAQRYSVGPRVLLALLELRAGWVTDPTPAAETLDRPMGAGEGHLAGLFQQLSWTAAELNSGYYGWKYGDWTVIHLADGSRVGIAPGLNGGSVAVQNYLAQVSDGETWRELTGLQELPSREDWYTPILAMQSALAPRGQAP